MKSIELQTEVEKLVQRRGELERDRAAAQDNLDAAREDLVQGKARSSEAVVAAQSKLSALAEAVVALVQRIAAKRADLAAAHAAEQREVELARFVEVAAAGEAALNQYLAEREQANAEIKVIAERLQASFDRLLAARNGWIELARSEVDEFLREVLDRVEAAGVDATGVCVQWSGSDPLPKSDDAYRLPPVFPYGNALLQILHLRAEAREKEALAAGKAA